MKFKDTLDNVEPYSMNAVMNRSVFSYIIVDRLNHFSLRLKISISFVIERSSFSLSSMLCLFAIDSREVSDSIIPHAALSRLVCSSSEHSDS